jgi:hypothetical protein
MGVSSYLFGHGLAAPGQAKRRWGRRKCRWVVWVLAPVQVRATFCVPSVTWPCIGAAAAKPWPNKYCKRSFYLENAIWGGVGWICVGVGPLVVCHYVRSRQQSWRGASFVQCAPPAGLLTPQFRFDSVDDPLFDRCVGCDLPSCPECRFSNGVMGFMEVVAFVSAQCPQIPSTPPRTPPTPHPYPTPFALHGFHFVSIQNIPALCRSQLSYPSSYVAWGSTFCLPYPTPHQPPSPSTPPTRHPPPTPLPTPHHHPPPHPQTKNNVIYIYI